MPFLPEGVEPELIDVVLQAVTESSQRHSQGHCAYAGCTSKLGCCVRIPRTAHTTGAGELAQLQLSCRRD